MKKMKIEETALCAQVGDKILDSKTNTIGTVVEEDSIGNYDLIYVNFGTKRNGKRCLRRICPIDDAQVEGRYHLIKEVKKMKKIKLRKLFSGTPDCWGWAWKCSDKSHRYMWQNDNDLGLLGQDLDFDIWVTKKIKIAKGGYLYLVTSRIAQDSDGTDKTIPQIKAILKDCHNIELTKREKILLDR